MRQVELYDTTLRDGAQFEGISFSVEDKLAITKKLDQLGVHYVEGGWPGSNPKDAEYFERAKELSTIRYVLWNSPYDREYLLRTSVMTVKEILSR